MTNNKRSRKEFIAKCNDWDNDELIVDDPEVQQNLNVNSEEDIVSDDQSAVEKVQLQDVSDEELIQDGEEGENVQDS